MQIFVFGSNRAGRHGKGAALCALREFGAIYGQGEGIQGNSYGIPTKDEFLKPLSLPEIYKHVSTFITFARQHSEYEFIMTRIGCGLAGYKDAQIKPFFKNVPDNVKLPSEWL